MQLGLDCMQEHTRIAKTMSNNDIEMVPYSFNKDFLFVCSIGFNIGFIVALIMM